MSDIQEDYCYGLDVSNGHDTGLITFKFLDTDKLITLTQLELSVMANYILDQFSTTEDGPDTLNAIKSIGARINTLESCLSTQISKINNPDVVDIDLALCKLGKNITDEDRNRLDKELPVARQSIMER